MTLLTFLSCEMSLLSYSVLIFFSFKTEVFHCLKLTFNSKVILLFLVIVLNKASDCGLYKDPLQPSQKVQYNYYQYFCLTWSSAIHLGCMYKLDFCMCKGLPSCLVCSNLYSRTGCQEMWWIHCAWRCSITV